LQFTNEADKCMNNIAEYEVILLGHHKLGAIGVQTCVLRTDSKVVSSKIEKECIVVTPCVMATIITFIRGLIMHQVPWLIKS
jgi:ribonuclease HI